MRKPALALLLALLTSSGSVFADTVSDTVRMSDAHMRAQAAYNNNVMYPAYLHQQMQRAQEQQRERDYQEQEARRQEALNAQVEDEARAAVIQALLQAKIDAENKAKADYAKEHPSPQFQAAMEAQARFEAKRREEKQQRQQRATQQQENQQPAVIQRQQTQSETKEKSQADPHGLPSQQ